MEPISKFIPLDNLPPEIQAEIDRRSALSSDERLQEDCDEWNKRPGELTGYDCPECLNRGGSYVVRDEYILFRECKCKLTRGNILRAQQSGLWESLKESTFKNFIATEQWQIDMKRLASNFLESSQSDGGWLFIGGQVGSGKTHLCTAVVGKLLTMGKTARYMRWRDDVVQLKASVNDDEEYGEIINPFKTADVLYIDDFFKTSKDEYGKYKCPTAGDINVAFELLNYRYVNKNLITLITSERSIDDLIDIDEAVGSRIYQMTKNYCMTIPADKKKNYRLFGKS